MVYPPISPSLTRYGSFPFPFLSFPASLSALLSPSVSNAGLSTTTLFNVPDSGNPSFHSSPLPRICSFTSPPVHDHPAQCAITLSEPILSLCGGPRRAAYKGFSRTGRLECEVLVRPVLERVIILGRGKLVGMVERAFMRHWVTRFGGKTVKPFVISNLGVPPASVPSKS